MSRHPSRAWLTALLTAGVSLWFARGSLDLVDEHGRAVRVAMLPSLTELASLVTLALLGGVALTVWLQHTDRPDADPVSRDLRRVTIADLLSPLFALSLFALPYLPWLPDWLPGLRLLAGPARSLLWLFALGSIAWTAAQLAAPRLPPPLTRVSGGIAVFAASLVAFGIGAARPTHGAFPSGDEPHYLIITQSLLRDHDLDLANNYRDGDYKAYYPVDLQPHFLARGQHGEIYSVHPIGLPVAAMPAFAVAGYPGVVAFLILLASTAAVLMWHWAKRVTGSAGAATFAWVVVCFGAPYFLNSFTVYPEIPAALAVIFALTWKDAAAAAERRRDWLLRGATVATLPWLSSKYAPMSAVLLLVLLARIVRARGGWARASHAVALAAPYAVSLCGWFAFFYLHWGTLSPGGAYGGDTRMSLRTLAAGFPGLLFDQEYGVLAYAPGFILTATGLVAMLRRGGEAARRAIEVVLLGGSLLATVGAFGLWWGGSSAPGRPVVSGLLLAGLPIAWHHRETSSAVSRALQRLLLFAGVWITAVMVFEEGGLLIAQNRGGISRLVEWASPTWHAWAGAPTFIAHDPLVASLQAAIWIGVAFLAARIARSTATTGAGSLSTRAIVTTVLAALGAAGLGALVPAPMRRDTPLELRARIPMLDDFDRQARPLALVYDPIARRRAAEVPALFRFFIEAGDRTEPQPLPVLLGARFALPAGDYLLRIRWSAAPSATDAPEMVALQIGRRGPPYDRWAAPSTAGWTERGIALPVDAIFVALRGSTAVESRMAAIELRPLRVTDLHERPSLSQVLAASHYGDDAFFFLDDNAYLEPAGFWVRGASTARMTVAMEAAAPDLKLRLHGGGADVDHVRLETPSWSRDVEVQGNTIAEVDVPVVRSDKAVRLNISSESGFVPAKVDEHSDDRRLLGCWVEVAR